LQEWLKRHGWVDKRTENTGAPQQSETPDGQRQLKSTGDQPAEDSEVKALQEEVQTWQRNAEITQKALEEAERHLNEAHRVIDDLTPLMVWAGHPCCVCEKPTDGVVDRETAAKLL
jgi:hypothetical protein